MPPLFSVVIPVYNRAKTIGPTIRSVLDQTLSDFELIVVDDGSSDELEPILYKFNDERLIYKRQENQGGGVARNTGILAAKGRWISFLDSDDLFVPSKLEVFADQFSDDPMAVLYSSVWVDRGVDRRWVKPSRGIRQGEDVGEYMFCENQVIQTSTIVLRTSLAQSILFDPTLRRGQDLDFCIRLQAAGATFQHIDEPLTVWSDSSEIGRTSYVHGAKVSLDWLERSEHNLTKRAAHGYRATVLVYHLAATSPVKCARYLLIGWARGGVSLSTTVRQILRSYIPRRYYRKMVNFFVDRFGRQ